MASDGRCYSVPVNVTGVAHAKEVESHGCIAGYAWSPTKGCYPLRLENDPAWVVRDEGGGIITGVVYERAALQKQADEGMTTYIDPGTGKVAPIPPDILAIAAERIAASQKSPAVTTLSVIAKQCGSTTTTIMPRTADLGEPLGTVQLASTPTSGAVNDYLSGLSGGVSAITSGIQEHWQKILLFVGAAAAVIILLPYIAGKTARGTSRRRTKA